MLLQTKNHPYMKVDCKTYGREISDNSAHEVLQDQTNNNVVVCGEVLRPVWVPLKESKKISIFQTS